MTQNNEPDRELSKEMRRAIDAVAHHVLEQIEQRAPEEDIFTFEECREQNDLLQIEGTEASQLDLDDKVGLIEDHARRCNLEFCAIEPEKLRVRIDELANQIVAYLGKERATELFVEMEAFMTEHELEVTDMRSCNPLADVSHQTEKLEGESCIVYRYRNVDGLDIDIYEYRFAGISFFFEKTCRR